MQLIGRAETDTIMNMSRNDLLAMVASILTTLHEADSGAPESTFYILCGMDLDKWNYIKGIMLRAEWITCKGNFVNITPAGTKTAIEINRAILAKQ
jgi:hypothetical protein